MNKKEFINKINYEDKNIISNIYDKIILAEKTYKEIFTNEFYPPSIWKRVEECKNYFTSSIDNYGIFDGAERRVLSFNNKFKKNYPIKLLKIMCKSKFAKVSHKDYLGSLMALGIKREKIGDIIVNENTAYCAANLSVVEYIIENLKLIKNNPCVIEIVDIDSDNIPKTNFEENIILTSSNRLDSIVSGIIGKSRTLSNNLIKEGKVLMNYSKELDKSKTVNFETVITIKGYGKFIVAKDVGKTQKGKNKILIKKYN